MFLFSRGLRGKGDIKATAVWMIVLAEVMLHWWLVIKLGVGFLEFSNYQTIAIAIGT